ncbi:hypothetical protein [Paractinoplanes rishiriensis]|uniref:Uncharacterized protein n=1 Tax=Paractinoplanes rishiriensis TaxID=1050105 RepID=A0A919MSW8_9ACTN|nr:hypothetical protein [Actinoplanes rishiriensis]GIE98646.1 hypothetical protein Ari01nite_61110 [Actinoplanes rishiriensis]
MAPTAVAPPPTAARLRAALLTAADLPGYGFDDPIEHSYGVGDFADICATLRGKPAAGAKVPTAQVALLRSKTGWPIVEILAATGSNKALTMVAGIAEAPRKCPAMALGELGNPSVTRVEVRTLEVPRVGDAAAGLRATYDGAGGATELVAFAHGDVFAVIAGMSNLEPAERTRIVEKAASKLKPAR